MGPFGSALVNKNQRWDDVKESLLKRPERDRIENFRILLVEDDAERAERIRSWLPRGVKLTVVTSAGKALGLIQRDRGRVYAGIMLDHDLQEQTATSTDRYLSGMDVVESVIRYVSKEVPVFVHSGNVSQAPVMAVRLEKAGFWVTRIPIVRLKREDLLGWLEDVRETWEDFLEEG